MKAKIAKSSFMRDFEGRQFYDDLFDFGDMVEELKALCDDSVTYLDVEQSQIIEGGFNSLTNAPMTSDTNAQPE